MDKKKFILNLVLILGVVAVLIFAFISLKDEKQEDRFSVNGSGVVYAKADIANLTVGFQTEVKKTAQEAVEENTDKMNDIIKELKSLDIEAKDIKTTNYSLRPVYDWTERRGQVLEGYRVSQNVTIKIRDLDKIGEAIAKTTQKGANQVGNVSFTIDDEYNLKNEARQLAIEKAKEKAEMIAEQTGMKLGDIINVYENSVYMPEPMRYTNAKIDMVGLGGAGEIEAPSIEAGQNEVRVEVSVVWEVE